MLPSEAYGILNEQEYLFSSQKIVPPFVPNSFTNFKKMFDTDDVSASENTSCNEWIICKIGQKFFKTMNCFLKCPEYKNGRVLDV